MKIIIQQNIPYKIIFNYFHLKIIIKGIKSSCSVQTISIRDFTKNEKHIILKMSLYD